MSQTLMPMLCQMGGYVCEDGMGLMMCCRARLAKIKQNQAKDISKRARHMGRKHFPFPLWS